MKYNTTKEDELARFRKRGTALIKKGAVVELMEAKDDGSDPQRRYLHAIMQIVARDRGIVFDKFKSAIIVHLGYYTEVMGVKVRQHTTEMSKLEYGRLIDDYYNWTISEGYLIPTSEEYLSGVLE
jgi:hypothetical protein